MRKIVLTLMMVVAAQMAMAQDWLFKKYEDTKGVETVIISKAMLSLAASSNQLTNVAGMDLRSIANKIDKVRIINCEKSSALSKVKNDVQTAYKKGGFEQLMSSNDDDSKMSVYYRLNGGKNEFAVVSIEKGELSVVNFVGSLTIDDIKGGLNL